MESIILKKLYKQYDIENLKYGAKTDKLGDVYEDYLCILFQDLSSVKNFLETESLEKDVIFGVLNRIQLNILDIESISSTRKVPSRPSGGNSKTDVILTVKFKDNTINSYTFSVKQSAAPKVAFAEFDVETICNEVGITDPHVKELMLKHQNDASAKNFTPQEKQELRVGLAPYAERLLRWTITMSPDEDIIGLAYPKWIIKFKLSKEDAGSELLGWKLFNIEEYIDHIRLTKKGTVKPGGFGTGLSWTYATGSKGKKIQFKG